MKHYQSCPQCSGTGRAREPDGVGDLCSRCGGTGSIIVFGSVAGPRTPFMRVLVAIIVVLLVFYLAFGIYLTGHSIDLTLELIILFAGHASVGIGLVLYFLVRSIRERG